MINIIEMGHNSDNVKKYIVEWLNSKNQNDFEFNLFNDIFNYIKKLSFFFTILIFFKHSLYLL